MIRLKQFKKSKEQDFFFAWHFQRKISGLTALVLKKTFITPNQITMLSILVGLYSFYLFFQGGAENDLIGILLYQLSFLLDCVDGDLARLRGNNKVKLSGMYFDYLRALLLEPLLPIFLAIGLVMYGYSELLVLLLVVVSFWRWTPQFSREHIVIRQLSHNQNLVQNPQLFEDMPKGIGKRKISLAGLMSKIVIIFWGLPIGLMNTITVLAFVGVYFLSDVQYNGIKSAYLILLSIFYLIHFLKASMNEYKLLDEFWK
jgi:phosphatidylglycerophosphate synthase